MAVADRPALPPLREVRCKFCRQVLFKANGQARVEIVCPDRACRRAQAHQLGARRG